MEAVLRVFSDLTSDIVVAVVAIVCLLVGILIGRASAGNGKSARSNGRSRRERDDDRGREGGGQNGDVEIYVGNLAYEVDEDDLLKAFGAYGKVTSARIIKNRFNGKSKGFAFVEMKDREEAREAIAALHNKELQGRKIVANEAKSKPRD